MIYKFHRASIFALQDKEKASSRYGATHLSVAVWRLIRSLLVLSPSTDNKKCTAIQASLMLCIFIVRLFSLSHLNRYSPSNTASIKIPTMMIPINKYCFFVSFSFKKMRDNNNETTHTLERIGAAIAPFPLIAYT